MSKIIITVITLMLATSTYSQSIKEQISLQDFTITKSDKWKPFKNHGICYTPLKVTDDKYDNFMWIDKISQKGKQLSLKEFAVESMSRYSKLQKITSQEAFSIEESQLGDVYVHKFETRSHKKYQVYFEHNSNYYKYFYSSKKKLYDVYFDEAMSILLSIKFKNPSVNKSDINSITGKNYNLIGRLPLSRPLPAYICQKQGKVIVSIKVNRDGKVIDATAGINGSTTKAKCLLKQAKKAALKTTWQPSQDAPEVQDGEIIYNFSLN